MTDSREIETLIKKAISCTVDNGPGSIVRMSFQGPFWASLDDLAWSFGVLCQACYEPLWYCECYTPKMQGEGHPQSSYSFPKQCTCEEQTNLNYIEKAHNKGKINMNGYLTEKTYCVCTFPKTENEWIELFQKRIQTTDRMNAPRDQRKRRGLMKIYGDQITSLHSEVSFLKNEMAVLKKALADALDALAQK